MQKQTHEIIRVFTDGACSGNPGIGGWAAVICKNQNQNVISGSEMKTTNNRMELTAVVKVLQNLKKLYSKKAKVEIYSDSAYVVNAVNQDWIKRWKANGWKLTSTKDDVKNRDLWEQLDHVMSLYEIKPELIKVKGHSGNRYNEMADKVAVWEVSIMKGEA